jgi:site-specific DNA-methyltransferase (adenine-specific)
VFYKSQCTYNPQFTEGKPYQCKQGKTKHTGYNKVKEENITINEGYRYPTNILEYKRDSNKQHPTQKPVALLEYLIKTYTNENELVLDNCMGVGSTGVAAKNLNRSFIGIELDDKYYNIAEQRINEISNKTN